MRPIPSGIRPALLLCLAWFSASCAAGPGQEALYGGHKLTEWSCRLHSSDEAHREEADADLRRIARESPGTVRAFIEAFRRLDLSEDERGSAVEALGRMSREDRGLILVVRGALRDESWFVRHEAIEAIRIAAPPDASSVPEHVEGLKDPDAEVRLNAAVALFMLAETESSSAPVTLKDPDGKLTEAGRAVLRAFRDPDRHVRYYAARGIKRDGRETAETYDEFVRLLADDYPPTAGVAAEAIGKFRSRHAIVVPLLTRLLSDSRMEVRQAAALALSDFAPEARGSVGALGEALRDGDADVRSRAAYALGRIGPAARGAIPGLLRALDDADRDVRMSATEALGMIAAADPEDEESDRPSPVEVEAAVKGLSRMLGDHPRRMAAGSLRRIGPQAAPAVPALVKALRDEDDYLRKSAAEALGAIGPAAGPAVPALIITLKDPEKDVRKESARALRRIGDRSAPLLAALEGSLGDPEEDVAKEASWVLACAGGPAIPVLLEGLRGDKAPVRRWSAHGLGWLAGRRHASTGGFSDIPVGEEGLEDDPRARLTREENAAVVAGLDAALGDADGGVREAACGALAGMGSAAAAALPAFLRALDDPEQKVRKLALWGLNGLGPAAGKAVPRLLRAVKEGSSPDRVGAIQALGRIAPRSMEPVPALIDALADGEPGKHAAEVLAWKGDSAVPALEKALKSGNPVVRRRAADALGSIGQSAAPVAGRGLLEALDDPEPDVRAAAAGAVGSVCRDAESAVPPLIQALRGGNVKVQAGAALALGRYGEKARPALPLLREALKGGDESLREGALRAVASIGADEETAKIMLAFNAAGSKRNAFLAFDGLCGQPALALDYLRAHPVVLEWAHPLSEGLLRMLRREGPAWADLRKAVLESDALPAGILASLGDPRNMPILRRRMDKASAHGRKYLGACARALGEPPDRVVRISGTEPGDFRPASAFPGIDRLRTPRGGFGHGDGFVDILVTGRLLMADGTPAVEPRFYELNDRYLLGGGCRDPVPIVYESKTGRFLYFTNVFGAFAGGKGFEPGPYQTGSSIVLIEARGAGPLRVRFFDEMPEVEITLRRAD